MSRRFGSRPPLRAAALRAAAVLAAALSLAVAPTAAAYDTGPHFDITRDALAAEGFNDTAIQTAQVSNWFVDLYENAESIPFSGHAGAFKELIGLGLGPGSSANGVLVAINKWPIAVVNASDRSHFDATNKVLSNSVALNAEWERLRRSVGALVRETKDPVQLLSVLGISLHTCRGYVKSLLSKLGVSSQLEAVVTAQRLGLIDRSDGG